MSDIVLVENGKALTTSFAIAEGTGIQHKAVIQLIRKNLTDFSDFGRVPFEMRPFATAGGAQNREVALLNEQQATLLMTYMRNSDVVKAFKKRLVKAFYELAESKPVSAEMSRLEILQMAIESEQQRIALKQEVEQLTPKADALDRIATSDGSMCITNAAKDLQVRPKDLFAWLSSHKWIYRRAGGSGWIAYQDKLQSGVLEHKVTVVTRTDGSEKTTEQVRVTSKGLTRLATVFEAQAA